MIKHLLIACTLCVFTHVLTAQIPGLNLPVYDPDSVREECKNLFNELRTKHPGYYRYHSAKEMDPEVDSVIASIQSELTAVEISRKLKPLIAKIGCLHTGISLNEANERKLDSFALLLPLALSFEGPRAFVIRKYENESSLPLGAEITGINGKKMGAIHDILMKSIPMDGYNQSGKERLLQFRFAFWYRNMIELSSTFEVDYIHESRRGRVGLKGVKGEVFPCFDEVVNAPFRLEMKGETAVMKIPSFSRSYYKQRDQNFPKEIKNAFAQLDRDKVGKLIVDLRGNTGGSDSQAADLVSYFFEEPFSYWDRIVLAEDMAKEVKGLARVFYGKPELQDSIWHWGWGGLVSRQFTFRKEQKAAKTPFKGEVYVLIDGLCLSSCADVAAVLHHNQKAVFIGEETGGGYQGNTSGVIPEEEMDCGLVVTVPLLKYYNAVDSQVNIGRGTHADYPIVPRAKDIIEGKDPAMEKALELSTRTP